jgi:hypothetical protein
VIHEGVALLQGLVARIAEAGRLRVDVAHATNLIHAAGTGVTLTLAAAPPEERDPRLSETMREAILTAITVPASAEAPNEGPDEAPATEQVAVHAIALGALLAEAPSVRPVPCRATAAERLARPTGDGEESRCPDAAEPPGSRTNAQRPSLEVVGRLGVRASELPPLIGRRPR